MGTTTTVVVEGGADLDAAFDAARAEILEIDRVCSRFRVDSELSRLNRGAGAAPVTVSPLLAEALCVALDAARATGGLVDPTVGRCLEALGYSVTFRDIPQDLPPLQLRVTPAAGWQAVELDASTCTVRLEAGVSVDLGATGKAWAADRAAAAAAQRISAGVAVDCGGDVAVAGPAPDGGWPVRVSERRGASEFQDVHIFDGGLATSGTSARRWRRGSQEVHHIVDPATGLPATTPWLMASVAAATCAGANTAATAAILLGEDAPGWLEGHGLPARLVDRRDRVVTVGYWPAVVCAMAV
jgi:FAD:protein FMN transferase